MRAALPLSTGMPGPDTSIFAHFRLIVRRCPKLRAQFAARSATALQPALQHQTITPAMGPAEQPVVRLARCRTVRVQIRRAHRVHQGLPTCELPMPSHLLGSTPASG